MSQSGIARALGVDEKTVRNDLRSENSEPESAESSNGAGFVEDSSENSEAYKPHLSQNTGNDEWYGKLGNTSHQG